ncbi:MAG: hypothetical protein GX025_09875 [Clostridiales bacterium]|nr:hypothetical protein [Clostridiales bacterium]
MTAGYKGPSKSFIVVLLLLIFLTLTVAAKLYLDDSFSDFVLSDFVESFLSKSPEPAVLPADIMEDGELMQALNNLALEDSRILTLLENSEEIPEPLLLLLVKNPEARDFVLAYPQYKNDNTVVEIKKAELSSGIPYFLQWDSRWGYKKYGSCVLGVTGCGPTCLSMLAVGLTGNLEASPSAIAAFSESRGYYVKGSGTCWELMTKGAESFGLSCKEIFLDEAAMVSELSLGHPLIISLGSGDFTQDGHFIVVSSYENGMFTIKDPNSPAKSAEGWYFDTLAPQINNIWSFEAA